MLLLQQTVRVKTEEPCSDYGQLVQWREQYYDQHTRSTVDLCTHCVPAFVQRQRFPPGCCD